MKRKTVLTALIVAVVAGFALLAMAGAAAATTTLHDQNNYGPDGAYGSGDAWPGPIAQADDFVVTASAGYEWNITQVFARGVDNNDLTSVTVTIYNDASDAPGTVAYQVNVLPGTGGFTDVADPDFPYSGGDLTIPIDATLGPGHYWLSIEGNGGAVGWGWAGRYSVSGDPAMTSDPTDYNGAGCTSWADLATCYDLPADTLDLMFTLSGTVESVGPVYAGTPGTTNCVGQTVSVLSNEYDYDLAAAAQALDFDSVKAMQQDIKQYCRSTS